MLRDAGLPEPKKDGFTDHLAPGSGNKLDRKLTPKDPNNAKLSDIMDLSQLEKDNLHNQPQYAEQSPADKLQALIQGLKNDTDGTFAAKALAENPDVVANFRAEQAEVLKESRQQQETAQNTPQMQEERSYGGRSFG